VKYADTLWHLTYCSVLVSPFRKFCVLIHTFAPAWPIPSVHGEWYQILCWTARTVYCYTICTLESVLLPLQADPHAVLTPSIIRPGLHWYSYLYQSLVQVTNLAFDFPRQV